MLEITQSNNNFNRELRLMDPRPYHFDYRKPRLSNPTYQSSHFYESIFSSKDAPTSKPASKFRNPQIYNRSFSETNQPTMKRSISTDINNKNVVDLGNMGSYRYGSKGNLQQAGKAAQSKMANIGSNLINNSSMDQTQVYKKQEKEFNIISFYPKEYKPNLRQFPKLTIQNRLIEINKNPIG